MTETISPHDGGDLDLRAVWSTAYMNDLPDSAFLYVESGGKKDDQGKTTPRSLRHFPYKDADGNVDMPHLRNALSRIPQSNLPADVKASLVKKAQRLLAAQDTDNDSDAGSDTDNDGRDRFDALELRFVVAPIVGIEVREPSESYDNTWTMSGYAAVFDTETTLYDGRFAKLTETIDRRAFDRLLREQPLTRSDGVVHFNYSHDMMSAVAATDVPAGQPGSLELRADSRGLFYTARVSRDDPDAVRMAAKMKTGVLKQASFAFKIGDADTETRILADGREEERRVITDVAWLADVCATPQGAYSATVSQLRSYALPRFPETLTPDQVRAALGIAPFDRTSEAEITVRPGSSGSGVARRQFEAQIMRDERARHHRR